MGDTVELRFCVDVTAAGMLRASFDKPLVPRGLYGAWDTERREFIVTRGSGLSPVNPVLNVFSTELTKELGGAHDKLSLISMRAMPDPLSTITTRPAPGSRYDILLAHALSVSDPKGTVSEMIKHLCAKHGFKWTETDRQDSRKSSGI